MTADEVDPESSGNFFNHTATTPPISLPTGSGGWSCKMAAVVWLRMLKVLGNINDIRDPSVHAEGMAGLYQIWSALKSVSGQADSGRAVLVCR